MNRILRGAAALAVGAGISLAGASAASAATPANTSAPIGVVCSSPQAWLRLWSTLGERCFRGNGVALVSIPGVRLEQIVGRHRVCLYSVGPRLTCRTGPAVVTILPAAWVRKISIQPPVG